jgi:alpha-mannosidase
LLGLSEVAAQVNVTDTGLSINQNDAGVILENALIRYELDAYGDITRIYDKQADREVMKPETKGNALLAFEDRPMNFDAWDIDIFYEDRTEKITGVESITVLEQGPLRAVVEIKRTYRSSQIHQKIALYHDSKRIDFDTWVDWHEQHTLLKAAFPVDVMSPLATFDVQWGNVERSTHRNTSWDVARFETCAHKWADLSEGNYGVALLNDCKYGYDIHDNVLRLTLLKSATSPDPKADQGEHYMTYSLLPHEGNWRAEVVQEAYALNDPLILRRVNGAASGTQAPASLVSVNTDSTIIETVKQAEDGNGIIVRLYENQRNRGKITLNFGFNVAEVYHANILEENQDTLTVANNQVRLDITPYQIITLRVIPQ